GEHAVADQWLADANRGKPGTLIAAGADLRQRYARGDKQGAYAKALELVPRSAEEHHDYWRISIVLGCLAANDIGRTAELRAALVAAQALPRDLTAAGFDAWVGVASPKVVLRQLAFLRRCVFTQAEADAPRREQLRAIFAKVEGPQWESRDE